MHVGITWLLRAKSQFFRPRSYHDSQEREILTRYEKLKEGGSRRSISLVLSALKICGNSKDLETGQTIHADVVESGDESNVYVANTLIDMYAKCGSMMGACQVFDMMSHRTVVSWNCIIMGYAQSGDGQLALQYYSRMRAERCAPNAITFLAALKACLSLRTDEDAKRTCLKKSISIHNAAVKYGHDVDIFVASTLIDIYAKCGSMVHAREVFETMPHHNVVAWNCIIMGYVQNGESELALQLYDCMQENRFTPNNQTYVAALKACSSLALSEKVEEKECCLQKGLAIHFQAAKTGHESNIFVATSLVDMYVRYGSMVDASQVFEKMTHRDVVSWNCIITGYVQQGENNLALQYYDRMLGEDCSPDTQTYVATLRACGNLVDLETGREIHAAICKAGLHLDTILGTCLVDFYGRCGGSMVEAQKAFDTITTRDLVLWNTLLVGYSRQGHIKHVFEIFESIQKELLQVDDVTFLALLTACSHAGLVERGKMYFGLMSSKHQIMPGIEHYTCMVDLFGRANQLVDAVALIRSMPLEANHVIWRTLLGACQKWTNVEVGKLAFDSLVKLNDKDAASYVLMANIYAGADMWEESAKIQAMRKKAGARKTPGQSWCTTGTT